MASRQRKQVDITHKRPCSVPPHPAVVSPEDTGHGREIARADLAKHLEDGFFRFAVGGDVGSEVKQARLWVEIAVYAAYHNQCIVTDVRRAACFEHHAISGRGSQAEADRVIAGEIKQRALRCNSLDNDFISGTFGHGSEIENSKRRKFLALFAEASQSHYVTATTRPTW
jgi:hypothetical protein